MSYRVPSCIQLRRGRWNHRIYRSIRDTSRVIRGSRNPSKLEARPYSRIYRARPRSVVGSSPQPRRLEDIDEEPCRDPIEDRAVAWGRYWLNQEWNLFITIEGFQYFVRDCMKWGIYPRITDFINGRVDIQVTGGTVENGVLMDTEVYGLSIRHNETTDLSNALRVVTKDTRVIDVLMQTYWGGVSEIRPDSGPSKKVKGFAINGPGLGHIRRPYIYTDNHSAKHVHSLLLSEWSSLVNLSLPALAFQKATEGEVLGSTACGYHLGQFKMSWLAGIKSLKALTIKGWFSCIDCRLEPHVSFEYGMTFIPASVELLKITGHMMCIAETPDWMKLFAGNLIQLLRKKRCRPPRSECRKR